MVSLNNSLLIVILIVYMKLFFCEGFKCPEREPACYKDDRRDEIVGLCVSKSGSNDYCNIEHFKQIYEYTGTCVQIKCPSAIKKLCSSDTCKNGGNCKNFAGSYSCVCAAGYHGRDCSIQGTGKYAKGIYFVFDPIIGSKRSSVLIFVKETGENMKIVFSVTSSGEVMTIEPGQLETTNNAKNTCIAKSSSTIREFCDYLPSERMRFSMPFYDVPFDNEEPGVIQDYNLIAKTDTTGFKANHITLSVYNMESEEFQGRFTQFSVYKVFPPSVCKSPVKLLVSGMKCVKPLQRKRNAKISIKSHFTVEFKSHDSSFHCSHLSPSYKWEIFNYKETIFKKDLRGLEMVSKNCDEVTHGTCHESYDIEPFQLQIGIYKIQLTVRSIMKSNLFQKEIKTDASGLCFIEIEKSPLIVVIEGGESRTVARSEPVRIDGSGSFDPNEPLDHQTHLRWSWTCKDTGISQNCCKDPSSSICEVNEEQFKLEVDKTYEFTLTLKSTKDGSSSEITQRVTISKFPQVLLEISCLKNCGVNEFKTNPREAVYFEVKVHKEFIEVAKNFVWKYHCGNGAPASVDNIKQDGVESRVLIIKENTLEIGSECKFIVEVAPSDGVTGSSTIDILVNKPPGTGVCKITPERGIKVVTKFTISCSNFTVEDESIQLVYAFYQRYEGQVSPGTLLGFSMSGEVNDVTLTENMITVRVSDPYGMYTEFNMSFELDDWVPGEEDMKEMLNNLHTFVSSRDSSNSARLAGAIIDVMGNTTDKLEVVNNVLDTLNKNFINDLSDVKLYSSTLKKVVTKGIKKLDSKISSKTVESIGSLMASLSKRLLTDINNDNEKSPAVYESEVKDIALTMLESSDVIVNNEDISSLDVATGTLAVFDRSNQYKRGTASMVRGLVYSGIATLGALLPHEKEVIISSENTQMWLKVESPENLVNLRGIPQNSSTKIKISEEFGKSLKAISENVALQVITFKGNPYWWDAEDRNVASEIVSVQTWDRSTSDKKLITDVSQPIDIYLKVKTTRSETLSGTVTMPADSDSEDQKDAAVTVHVLEGPPENSNGKLFVEFKNFSSEELQVLMTENKRPDYEMMSNKAQTVTAKSPSLSLSYNNVTTETLHFIGILPGRNVKARQIVQYTFSIYSIQCKTRLQTVWTSPACTIGKETSKDTVHCRCSHMSFFGSSIFVAPNTVNPINDMYLLLTIKDNPLVFLIILSILILYVLLLTWALIKDKNDKQKRKVIVLEDNFPGEAYPYLVVVYTAFNYGAGTDANVGIMLVGSKSLSRPHILRSQHRKVFRRNSDDWFLIFSPVPLGNLKAIHLWHDNSGSHPDWYCKKVMVYDIHDGREYTFILEQWLSVWPEEHTEAVACPAGPNDMYQWKRVIVHNILYNLREKHLWLSIYMSHPRATVTKSQRVTIAFCAIIITLLTGIMFYGVARGNDQSDEPAYVIKTRVLIISVESAIIATLCTAPVVICFRRSQKITSQQQNRQFATGSIPEIGQVMTSVIKNFLRKLVRGKPLIPVLVGKESAESVIIRRRWSRSGWIISQIVIWGGGYLVILYGLKLGKVISKLWVTSAGISIVTGAFVNSPVKIIVISTLLAMFGELYNVTTYEYDVEAAMKKEYYGDRKYLENVIKLRSSQIYNPLQWKKISVYRQAAMKRVRILEHLEFFATIVLFLTLLNVTGEVWRVKTYYVNSHIKMSLTKSWGPLAIPLEDVTNLKKLTDYLVSKLMPELYRRKWYNKQVKLTSPEESLSEMGWMSDTVHRLVGVPRMRQLRVKPDNCSWSGLFNETSVICIFALSHSTEDNKNYGLSWGAFSKDVNKPLLAPWSFQETEPQSKKIYGMSGTSYHTGGYMVELYETQDKCNSIIADLMDTEWWDIRMRAFIVELTLYNPNTDSYSLVTIVTEHLPSGAFTNRVQVVSAQLSTYFFWIIPYLIVLIYFNINLFLFVNRQGIAFTSSSFWGCYDFGFVGLSDITVALYFVKAIKEAMALEVFQQAGSSGFFYFSDIVWFQKISLSMWTLVVCLTPIRILKFKLFVSTCKAACHTLYKAGKLLTAVSFIILSAAFLQLFVINFVISPESLPFDLSTRFYTADEKEIYHSSYRYHYLITSLLFTAIIGASMTVLQMIIINMY